MEHLDEIAENINARNAKIEAYDAIIAEQNAKKEAQENLAKHKAKCEELRKKLEAEMQLLAEAEALVGSEVE
jgi:ABC-type Fe3+-citrate transport system substrate-binding protein